MRAIGFLLSLLICAAAIFGLYEMYMCRYDWHFEAAKRLGPWVGSLSQDLLSIFLGLTAMFSAFIALGCLCPKPKD